MPSLSETGVTVQSFIDRQLDAAGWPGSWRAAEPNTDYLGKLKELIRSKVKDGDISDDDVKAIIRAAAGYAGGKARARNRVSGESFAAAEGDTLWVGFWLPSEIAHEIAIPGGEAPGDLHLTLVYLGEAGELPADAAERVRIAVQAFAQTVQPLTIRLSGVARFPAETNKDGKDVIYASIDGDVLMDFRMRLCLALWESGIPIVSDHHYTPHVTLAYVEPGRAMTVNLPDIDVSLDSVTVATSREPSGRETFMLRGVPYRDAVPLMMSERAMMEPPATIPVLPKPGTYTHPVYGKIEMSPERIASFVDNFEKQVYQDRLPIDLEHETKLSGAAGWITGLQTNADGSVDAAVEWNERGAEALRDDRFFYISPEWYDEWKDPIDGEWHKNVLMGAALTTRPFFKPGALRSLAASEMSPITQEGTPMPEDTKANEQPTATPAPTTATVALSEEQARRFSELEAENVRLKNEAAASKTASEAAVEQSKQLAERVTAMEKADRRKRFTAEVTGKSEAGGPRWFGEVDKNVAVLEHLADTVGEESELFTGHVANQRALAEQMKSSALFSEAGTSTGGDTGASDPQSQITAMAEKRAAEKGINLGEAQRQVVAENPDLARRAGEQARIRV